MFNMFFSSKQDRALMYDRSYSKWGAHAQEDTPHIV